MTTNGPSATKNHTAQRASLEPAMTKPALINLLPVELLLMIFQITCWEFNGSAHYATYAHRLASVCQSWRLLAFRAADLWTEITINLSSGSQVPALEFFLEKSRNLPLNIVVSSDHHSSGDVVDIMKLLGHHIERWQSLHFDVVYFSCILQGFSKITGDAAKLLDFRCTSDCQRSQLDENARVMYFNSPALQTLSMTGSSFADATLARGNWFPCLHSLTLSHFDASGSYPSFSDALRQLDNLVYLHFNDFNISHRVFVLAKSTFKALNELVFEAMRLETITAFMKYIHTPSLATLSVIKCASPLPDNDPFIRILAESRGSGWSCPRLESLTLMDCPGFSSASVRRIIEGREMAACGFADVVSIRQLNIHRCGTITEKDINWFEGNINSFLCDPQSVPVLPLGTSHATGSTPFEICDVVLAKIRGYPRWPVMIVDPVLIPAGIKESRSKSKKPFYCVRFFPTGEYAWVARDGLSHLHQKDIQSFAESEERHPSGLQAAYTVANRF